MGKKSVSSGQLPKPGDQVAGNHKKDIDADKATKVAAQKKGG